MTSEEIWEKLKTQDKVQMPFGSKGLFAYFDITNFNDSTKTFTIRIDWSRGDWDFTELKAEDYQKEWWFIDDKVKEKIRKPTTQEMPELGEQMILRDIIDIYNGIYENYDKYYKKQINYNLKCRKHNQLKQGENCFTFTYKPEKTILPKRHFDFIRLLALKRGKR